MPEAGSTLFPVELERVGLVRDGLPLLDNLTLKLADQGITVIMGSNGAGKTLLLRLLHGLEQPSSGTILFAGAPVTGQVRERQAMVFQKPVLLRRSVRGNMDFVLALGGRVDRASADTLLDQAGLLSRADQPARLLSGGEQQRLALARALATGPQMLFLDEPTASLDPASVLQIEEAVVQAHQRGIKIIYVTHDVGQAKRLAGEVIFLHQGRLEEQTSAESFFTSPSSRAARAYLEGRIFL